MRTKANDQRYLRLLRDLEKAHRELVIFYNDGDADPEAEYHLMGMQMYPFERSFDEYLKGLRNWIKAVEHALESGEFTCPNCNEEYQKGNYCSNCGEPL